MYLYGGFIERIVIVACIHVKFAFVVSLVDANDRDRRIFRREHTDEQTSHQH